MGSLGESLNRLACPHAQDHEIRAVRADLSEELMVFYFDDQRDA
jgi:hypothetical protein